MTQEQRFFRTLTVGEPRLANSDPETAPRPGIILLDLNMPRKDGREALERAQ